LPLPGNISRAISRLSVMRAARWPKAGRPRRCS